MYYCTDLTLLLEEVEARITAFVDTEAVLVGRCGSVGTVSPVQTGDLRDAVALFLFSPTSGADGSPVTELLGYRIAHEGGAVRFRRFSPVELRFCYGQDSQIRFARNPWPSPVHQGMPLLLSSPPRRSARCSSRRGHRHL